MPSWTGMRALSTNDLVLESDMDAIQGNIEYLLNPNKGVTAADAGAYYNATNTSWAYVSSAQIQTTITSYGGPILCGFMGVMGAVGLPNTVTFDLTFDWARVSNGNFGAAMITSAYQTVAMTHLVTGAASGVHTLSVQWKGTTTNGHNLDGRTAGNVPTLYMIEL